jgi:F0F1-type ATP synthase assembly protein I
VQKSWKDSANQATLGLEIALGLLLPGYLGSLLDTRLDTGSTFMWVGAFVGIAHGVRAVMRVAKEGEAQARAEEQAMRQRRAEYHAKRSA